MIYNSSINSLYKILKMTNSCNKIYCKHFMFVIMTTEYDGTGTSTILIR